MMFKETNNMNTRLIITAALTLTLPLIVFAQTNGYISFQFTIDNSTPIYNSYEINTTTINNLNEEVLLSCHWSDDFGLSYYYFEWNITNSFVNDTQQSFIGNWSNTTKRIDNPDYEGRNVYLRFYAYDENNNPAATTYQSFSILNKAPEYDSVAQNTSNPVVGGIVELSSHWTDNFNVNSATLQINTTGTYQDTNTTTLNSTGWSNFYFDTTGHSGETFYWRIKASDNVANTNTTTENYFTVQ